MSTILPMTHEPVATRRSRDEQELARERVEERVHVAPARRASARAPGRSEAPSAPSARTGPARSASGRAGAAPSAPRTVSTTRSSTSAEFEPISRWSRATSATWSRSRLSIRSTDDLQRVLERHAELLLGEHPLELALGRLGASSATTASAPTRLCPARSAEASTSRLSGSCSAKRAALARTFAEDHRARRTAATRPSRMPTGPSRQTRDRTTRAPSRPRSAITS